MTKGAEHWARLPQGIIVCNVVDILQVEVHHRSDALVAIKAHQLEEVKVSMKNLGASLISNVIQMDKIHRSLQTHTRSQLV